VASKNPAKRILAALGALDAADGPISRLEAARQLREAAEELETAQVEAARKAGATWHEIGACYGLTKQGAQQRFRAVRDKAKAEAAAAAAAAAKNATPQPLRPRACLTASRSTRLPRLATGSQPVSGGERFVSGRNRVLPGQPEVRDGH